jgi:flavin-binding protein dodecin
MAEYVEGPPLPVVKVIEMVGESPHSWADAAKEVIAEAQKTLRRISHIRMIEFDVRLRDDRVDVFRVRAEVAFRLEASE